MDKCFRIGYNVFYFVVWYVVGVFYLGKYYIFFFFG